MPHLGAPAVSAALLCSLCIRSLLAKRTLIPAVLSVALLRAGFRLGKGDILLSSVSNVFGSMMLTSGENCLFLLRVPSLQQGFIA